MYSIVLLVFFIILVSFCKKEIIIKLYTSLYCVSLCIINIFQYNTLNYFSKDFSIVIPFICLLCSIWITNNNIYKYKPFCISFLLFVFFATEAFIQDNIFFIYACIEISFIPMITMLLFYNKDYKLKIIYQYLLYTLISAIFILIGIIEIYNNTNSVLLSEIYKIGVKNKVPLYMLSIGTAIKLPIFPFHYWVPSVHGRAPGICSVLLSSIVLKFSSLILLKIIIPLFNISVYKYIWYFVSLGILISSLQAIYSKNLKIIIAYSSIIHMGLYTFILQNYNNTKYFIYCILQHTFTMTLSFLVLDLLKNNYKDLTFNKIIIKNKHELILLIISTLTIIDFPVTWGFIAEIISIFSIMHYNIIIASIVGLSLLLYSSYLVYICFIVFKNSNIINNTRINIFYIIIISILIFIIILLGIIPKIYL